MDALRVLSDKTAHANARFPGTRRAAHSTAAPSPRTE